MATFVLVHGAYQGGWIWKPVATRLRAAGHTVYAPTLDGCAERAAQVRPGITIATHAQEIAQFLFHEDLRDVVLAGTSAGGMVIQKASEQARDRIARLAFVDALALLPGEKVDGIVKRPAPNRVGELTTGPSKEDAANRMFKDLDPVTKAWALERLTQHPIAALEAPMVDTTFWDLKWTALVVRCTQAVNPPEHHQKRTADKLGAKYVELDTGHYPMLSAPDELTRLLQS
jgi:pimeloyl-ACP methyl ester carboxylesterase